MSSASPGQSPFVYRSHPPSGRPQIDSFPDESLQTAEKWLLHRKLNAIRSLTSMMAGIRYDTERTGVHIAVGRGSTPILEESLPNLIQNIIDPGRSGTFYFSVSEGEAPVLDRMLKRNGIPVTPAIEGSQTIDAKIAVQPHTAKAPAMHKTLRGIVEGAAHTDAVLPHEFMFADVETQFMLFSNSGDSPPFCMHHGALGALRLEREENDLAFISAPWVLGTGISHFPEQPSGYPAKPPSLDWEGYNEVERLMLEGEFGALWGGATVGDSDLLLPLGIVATEDPGIVTEDLLITVFATLLNYRWCSSCEIGGFNTARPGASSEISDQMKRWIKASADLEILFGEEVAAIMPNLWNNHKIARGIVDHEKRRNFLTELEEAYMTDWYEVRGRFLADSEGWKR